MVNTAVASHGIGCVLVEIYVGDISSQAGIDAIVNPTSRLLLPGEGVSKAIFARAGKDELSTACSILGPLETSGAVITPGYKLQVPNIIHCHGPKYSDYNSVDTLESTYWNVFELAEAQKISSLAIPAISAGAFGVPIEVSARTAVESIKAFSPLFSSIRNIRLVLFDQAAAAIYAKELCKPIDLPEKLVSINSLDASYSPEEFNLIKRGYLGDQDSKWFFYFESPWLCVYRGNRKYGRCYYWLRFSIKGSKVVIDELLADPESPWIGEEGRKLIQYLLEDRFGLLRVSVEISQVGEVEFWEKRGKGACQSFCV